MALAPPSPSFSVHQPGVKGWVPGRSYDATARTFRKVVVLMENTPTYLVGELTDYHPFEKGRQLWTVRMTFPLTSTLFNPVVTLEDSQVWAVPSSVWNNFYLAQSKSFDIGMRTMVKFLEERFFAICREHMVSLQPSTHILALAMDIGVSAGHVQAVLAKRMFSDPPLLQDYGQHTVRHFDRACMEEVRKVALERIENVRRSLVSSRYNFAAVFNPSSAWATPALPYSHLVGSRSVSSLLSTTTAQVSHEAPTENAPWHLPNRRESWTDEPTHNSQRTRQAFPNGTFPRHANGRGTSTRPFVDEGVSGANERSEPSGDAPRGTDRNGSKSSWWGSLKGWRAKKSLSS